MVGKCYLGHLGCYFCLLSQKIRASLWPARTPTVPLPISDCECQSHCPFLYLEVTDPWLFLLRLPLLLEGQLLVRMQPDYIIPMTVIPYLSAKWHLILKLITYLISFSPNCGLLWGSHISFDCHKTPVASGLDKIIYSPHSQCRCSKLWDDYSPLKSVYHFLCWAYTLRTSLIIDHVFFTFENYLLPQHFEFDPSILFQIHQKRKVVSYISIHFCVSRASMIEMNSPWPCLQERTCTSKRSYVSVKKWIKFSN